MLAHGRYPRCPDPSRPNLSCPDMSFAHLHGPGAATRSTQISYYVFNDFDCVFKAF